jgi:hypothetical protein
VNSGAGGMFIAGRMEEPRGGRGSSEL